MDIQTAPTAAEAAALNVISEQSRRLRHALDRASADAALVRERLDSGQRPAYSTSGVFGSSVLDAQTAVAHIDAALEILGDPPVGAASERKARVHAAFTGTLFTAPEETP